MVPVNFISGLLKATLGCMDARAVNSGHSVRESQGQVLEARRYSNAIFLNPRDLQKETCMVWPTRIATESRTAMWGRHEWMMISAEFPLLPRNTF